MNRFFITVIQLILFIDATNQSKAKLALTTFKAIGKTIKTPLLQTIGNTIKMPMFKTFGNTMKNSVGMLRPNKNTIKKLACNVQEKYLSPRNNFGVRAVKYLGEEGIKKFKYIAPQAAKGGEQIARVEGKKSIQRRSAMQMGGKVFRSVVKKSAEQIKGKELSPLINMALKSNPQLPILFGVGGLNQLTQRNLIPQGLKDFCTNDPEADNLLNWVKRGLKPIEDPNALPPADQVEPYVDDETNHAKLIKHLAKTSRLVYEGEYDSIGKMSGEGKITYQNGDVFDGNLANNEYNGKGKLTQANGNIFEGDFVDGKMHGKGQDTIVAKEIEPIEVKKKRSFISTLKDTFTGKGGEPYAKTEEEAFVKQDYKGDFVHGKRHGKGECIFHGQGRYIGSYVDGERCGYGEYFQVNGDNYKGQWKNDVYHGNAKWYIKARDHTRNSFYLMGHRVRDN